MRISGDVATDESESAGDVNNAAMSVRRMNSRSVCSMMVINWAEKEKVVWSEQSARHKQRMRVSTIVGSKIQEMEKVDFASS